MAAGPLLRWRRDQLRVLAARLAIPGAAAVVTIAVVFLLLPVAGVLPRLGLIFAGGVAIASLAPLAGRDLRRTPLHIWGMVIAHFGIAVALAGMASESAFTRETLVAARPGETLSVGPWSVRFVGVEPVAGPNWTAIRAQLEARRGGTVLTLEPEARMFNAPPTETTESAIATRPTGQLYTVLGKSDGGGRWQLRLWWKPMVTLIWAGGALVAIGGALALLGRLRRERRREAM